MLTVRIKNFPHLTPLSSSDVSCWPCLLHLRTNACSLNVWKWRAYYVDRGNLAYPARPIHEKWTPRACRQKKGIFTEKSSKLRQTINRKCGINLTKPYTVIAGLRVAQQALEISLASGLQRETTGARRRIDLLRELDNHRRHPPEVPATL